ncbi:Major facilitator superfamily domain general substrate transporter [Fusarium albosuccineum]|uniref:Major facilitator superfamily domain general substrate transporter n=1 Tax=Fusarium albosuccineum TaxID=1237068 RepID=A0A8H4PDV6_9HYPO|nr:Major facilitator superfamily domain general substrate transporter [Fusarium albosuccineum]
MTRFEQYPSIEYQATGPQRHSCHDDSDSSSSTAKSGAVRKAPSVAVGSADEETPLLGSVEPDEPDRNGHQLTQTMITVLLVGELVSHADTTLIFAAAPQIASELGSLRGIGWLATAYTLGVCSMQPLYGRLSDVFGRRQMLLFAYIVLSVGCVLCALSRTLVQIIVARAISGIGGAGVMTMASIIITDSVPRDEFAKYGSYINLATTLGRSIGGPIGGLVADSLGWQWLFWGRLPLFAISVTLVMASSGSTAEYNPTDQDEAASTRESFREKWKKVDVKGAAMLTKTIVSFILLLDTVETGLWTPSFWALSASVLVFGQLFVLFELFGTKSPIFNLRILVKHNVALSYLVDYLQVFSQVSMMFSVPLYFQVTQRASAAKSGAHIVPAVVANTIGALASGKMVQLTHRHKYMLVMTGLLGSVSYTLIILRWNGNTMFWESLYIIFGGFATGVAQSASFVTMASHLERKEVAMATGGFFLVSSLGTVSAVTTTNVLLQSFFSQRLNNEIHAPNKAELIGKITSDIDNIAKLTGRLREIVVNAFVQSLKTTYVSGLVACLLSSSFALLLRDLAPGEQK